MKRLFFVCVYMSAGFSAWAFPWNTPSCALEDTWCRDNRSGFSSFSSWSSLPSSGYGSPYQKHERVPVEHILPRPHILSGLFGLGSRIENAVEMILEAESPQMAVEQLQSEYGLTDLQARGILNLPLELLTEDGLAVLRKEYLTFLR